MEDLKGIEELKLQEMALVSKMTVRLHTECGLIRADCMDTEVHVNNEAFKELFPEWDVEEREDEFNYLVANAYGVKFYALERKDK